MSVTNFIDNNLFDNRIRVKEDRMNLRRKGIKSPNVRKLKFYIYDKKEKAKFFYATEERYRSAFKRMVKQKDYSPGDFDLSHPELCQKIISDRKRSAS